jgi:hypothetical protein
LAYDFKGAFDGLNDSDDEDGENMVINVRTAMLDAKKGAITAIGEIAAHCGEEFLPYLEETITILQNMSSTFHSLLKAEAAEALSSMVIPVVAVKHGGSIDWKKGDIAGTSRLSPEVTAVASAVLKILVSMMNDVYSEIVSKACSGIESILNLCGPHAMVLVGNELLEATIALLTKTAPCQLADIDEEDGDDYEHDSYMLSVCDLVATFGRTMGPHFCQYLPQFIPAICEFAKTSRPSSDRAMATGCLGELAQELGEGIKDYWTTVYLPLVLTGLADKDHHLNRNAAFCGGTCCEGLGAYVASDYVQILQAVGRLFNIDPSLSESAAAAVDNASACVCRMIMASPNNVPMSQVLPVVLKALPLKNDFTENETVYKCLLGLLQNNNTDALSQKVEMSRVFAEATSAETKVDKEMQEKLKMAMQGLN